MNFKTETTFEGRVLNGKILDNKVVLDELFGVSLVDEIKLDSSQIYQLIGDLNTICSNLKVATIGKDKLIINNNTFKDVINGNHLASDTKSDTELTYKFTSSIIEDKVVDSEIIKLDDTVLKWIEIIEKFNKRLKEFDKDKSNELNDELMG